MFSNFLPYISKRINAKNYFEKNYFSQYIVIKNLKANLETNIIINSSKKNVCAVLCVHVAGLEDLFSYAMALWPALKARIGVNSLP